MKMTSLLCDFLIDQGRKIGLDAVGHKCSRPAAWRVRGAWGKPVNPPALACEECWEMLSKDPIRLSLLPPWGEEYQRKMIKTTISGMKK